MTQIIVKLIQQRTVEVVVTVDDDFIKKQAQRTKLKEEQASLNERMDDEALQRILTLTEQERKLNEELIAKLNQLWPKAPLADIHETNVSELELDDYWFSDPLLNKSLFGDYHATKEKAKY